MPFLRQTFDEIQADGFCGCLANLLVIRPRPCKPDITKCGIIEQIDILEYNGNQPVKGLWFDVLKSDASIGRSGKRAKTVVPAPDAPTMAVSLRGSICTLTIQMIILRTPRHPHAAYALAVVNPHCAGGVWSLRRVCDGAKTRQGNASKFTDMTEPEGSISP